MNDKPNILFDLDGTLIHSLPGIEEALQATLKHLGRNSYDKAAFRPLVGYPLEKVFKKLLGEDDPDVGIAVRIYRRFYMDIGLPQARPYGGIPKMLEALHKRNRSLHIVTARNEEVAKAILEKNGMIGYILSVRGERQGDGRESKTDLLTEVIRDQRLDPEDTVMVGDRRFDTEAALANGCVSIGVTYGYGSREELIESGADLLVDTPGELEKLLWGEKGPC
jgi:phosphoglycolate phosphatase